MKTCFQSCSELSSEGCGFLPHCPVSTRIWSNHSVQWWKSTCKVPVDNRHRGVVSDHTVYYPPEFDQIMVKICLKVPVDCPQREISTCFVLFTPGWPYAFDLTIRGWCDVKIGKLANLHMLACKMWWYLDVAREVHLSLQEIFICVCVYVLE